MYFEFHHSRRDTWLPAVDVFERPDEIVILVEMPGVDRSDVQLSWHDGLLTISGVKRAESETEIARFHRVERGHGQFHREIAINSPIDHEKCRAELRDGLMRIYLPKRRVNPEIKSIPIVE